VVNLPVTTPARAEIVGQRPTRARKKQEGQSHGTMNNCLVRVRKLLKNLVIACDSFPVFVTGTPNAVFSRASDIFFE
jgi:hypothetical protein